jgi:glycosyltransferase involved in cell wall biosynthesis
MISIGAAIIVKNAAETISTAIKSILPLCRQIVVVDTGSTDKTPSICSKLGAEVYFHKWKDDFSEARNVALDFMRTDWIIAIDADEELIISGNNPNHLTPSPSPKERRDNGGLSFIAHSHDTDGKLIISDKNPNHLTPSPSPKERDDQQKTSNNSHLLWRGAGGEVSEQDKGIYSPLLWRGDRGEVLKYLDLLENPQIGGLNIIIENYLGNDSSSAITTHRYTRIFRRHAKIRYEGRIHEQIRPSIESAGYTVIDNEILIRHYGYSEINPEKIKRNIMLLEKELSEKPNDTWIKYHLAETKFADKNFVWAKEIFMEIYNSSLLSSYQMELCRIRLAQIELSFEQLNDMDKWLNFISNDNDIEGLRLFVTAAKLSLQRRFSDALKIYQSEEVRNSSLVDKNKLKEATEIMAMLIKKFISF